MPESALNLFGIPLPSDAPLFLGLVSVHILAGLGCVVAGAVGMLSTKGRGRHSSFGAAYYWSLSIVFATSTVLSAMRWAEDWHLFVLGARSFGVATIGRAALRQRWRHWLRLHIGGMGISYIVLLTAFYVDNGPNLPVWRALPAITYWTVPAAIGLPILFWALLRHRLVRPAGTVDSRRSSR